MEKTVKIDGMKCDGCGQMLFKEDVVNNHYSCYKCGKYFRLTTTWQIKQPL